MCIIKKISAREMLCRLVVPGRTRLTWLNNSLVCVLIPFI